MTETLENLFDKQETLCNELQGYVSSMKLGKESVLSLRHPLLYCIMYSPQINALLNYQFKMIKSRVNDALKNNQFHKYVFLHERPYRFNAFMVIHNEMNTKEKYKLLSEIWIDSENIHQNFKEWKSFFKNYNNLREFFMTEEELEVYNSFSHTLTVYRGCDNQNQRGLSYTLDKQKAEWFANRFNKNGKVIEKTVFKSNIFAYLNRRDEEELIIL